MFIEYNPNPTGRRVEDCSVRAISKALETDWETAYSKLCLNGFAMGNLPNANEVIGSLLRENGFYRKNIPNTCPDCYTIGEFAEENTKGTFVVGTGSHVVSIHNGNIYDIFDSSDLVPIYVWYKETEPRFREGE